MQSVPRQEQNRDLAKTNLGFNHNYLQFNNVVPSGKSHSLPVIFDGGVD